MPSRLPDLKFFSGRSNPNLANAIVQQNGIRLSPLEIIDFANKEIKIKIQESIRGEDVFLLQTCGPPDPNRWLMELLIMIHTAKRASARRITAIIPYLYGSRQDRKSEPRTPITIQLVANLLEAAGLKRIITVTLHNHASIAAFNNINVDNLSSGYVFMPVLKKLFKKEPFVVFSPDAGGVERAKYYSDKLGTKLGFAYKIRPKDNEAEIFSFVGDVEGQNVLIIDDMIDTAGTLCKMVAQAKKNGAKKVFVCATHALFSRDAIERINASHIDALYITDSIHHENLPLGTEVVSLGELLYKAMINVNEDKSLGKLFDEEQENP